MKPCGCDVICLHPTSCPRPSAEQLRARTILEGVELGRVVVGRQVVEALEEALEVERRQLRRAARRQLDGHARRRLAAAEAIDRAS